MGVKNATTIKNYLGFLQNTYLLFLVSKYDFALKKQIQNSKKIYFIDNALINRLGFCFSGEKGRMLENLVFIELKRGDREIFYHNDRFECDFVIKNGVHITEAMQVCHTFDLPDTREREIRGLMDAMQRYGLKKGMIITNDMDETVTFDGYNVDIVPAWKWLVGKNVTA